MNNDSFFYAAEISLRVGRNEDAIDLMEELARNKLVLDKDERNHFLTIFKEAIDPPRYFYRILDFNYIQFHEDGENKLADLIQVYLKSTRNRISAITHKGLEILQKVLIPEAKSVEEMVFYEKMKGDLHRYLSETSNPVEKAKAIMDSRESYHKALKLCEDNLEIQDPVRLGVILNWSVFIYEHLKETSSAIELIVSTLEQINDYRPNDSDPQTIDFYNAKSIMETNLKLWYGDSE